MSELVSFPVSSTETLVRALSGRVALAEDGEEPVHRTYLDTFDWRLHRAGWRLTHQVARKRPELVLQSEEKTATVRLRGRRPPSFSTDVPHGPVADRIAKAAGIRRLLPVATVAGTARRLRVLDDERKTVVRLALLDATVSGTDGAEVPPPGSVLEVRRVRGYDEPMEEMLALLEHELDQRRFDEDELERALLALGRAAGDYSSKPRFELDPEERADRALRRILAALREVVVRNEDGTRRHLDPEFLHDFRVATRRSRSALAQIPDVLPAGDAEFLSRELSWLGSVTGRLRDLDVHRLDMPRYRDLLPPTEQRHLDALDRHLAAEQSRERRTLANRLRSKRYRGLLEEWHRISNAGEDSDAPKAATPIGRLGRRRVRKSLDRLLRRGGAVTSESAAEELHRVRIEGKKLRYLLEFFRSLASEGDLDDPLRGLKKLQDNLGVFNDLEVQQRSLAGFAEAMLAERSADAAAILSIGRLVEKLAERQTAERRRFDRRFRRFAAQSGELRELFR